VSGPFSAALRAAWFSTSLRNVCRYLRTQKITSILNQDGIHCFLEKCEFNL